MRVMHVYQEQGYGLQLTVCLSLLVESALVESAAPLDLAALKLLLLVVDLVLVAYYRNELQSLDTCAIVSRPSNPVSPKVCIHCCKSKRRQGQKAPKLCLAKTGR